MLRFFLRHYIDRLGLLPHQMNFYVFASNKEGEPIVQQLRQRGVARVQTVQTPFNDQHVAIQRAAAADAVELRCYA